MFQILWEKIHLRSLTAIYGTNLLACEQSSLARNGQLQKLVYIYFKV